MSEKNGNISGDVICADVQDSSNCDLLINLPMEEAATTYLKLVPVKSGGSAKVQNVKELTILDQVHEFKLGGDTLKITRGNQQFDLTVAGVLESFKIGYNYYQGFQGLSLASGAYIFLPSDNNPRSYSTISKIYFADGTNFGVVTLSGDKTLTKVIFSKLPNYVRTYGFEIETFIDSIPINDGQGKEVTLNFKSNYKNNKTFYTDSMGLE